MIRSPRTLCLYSTLAQQGKGSGDQKSDRGNPNSAGPPVFR
jgi:hypothetical protein